MLKKYLFWILVFLCIVSYFGRKNLSGINDINQALFQEPIQTKIPYPKKIEFVSNGYVYELTPLFEYNISALIVSKFTYDIFNVYKYGRVFPVDLCLIWGGNVRNEVYRNKSLSFSQDCRFCNVQWGGSVNFNFSEFSNNHLVVNDNRIRRIINSLSAGDQVLIKGKLVNVKAVLLEKSSSSDLREFQWKTSTTRDDSEAGACEVIYVEDIEILKKGNVFFHFLFLLSFYGIVILVAYKIIRFFRKDISAQE